MKKRVFSVLLALCLIAALIPMPASAAGNTFQDATPITLGQKQQGSISEENKCDMYSFTLPSSGRITLNAVAYMEYITYRIYDETGAEIWSTGLYWNSTSQTISGAAQSFDLLKGSYFFSVERRYDADGSYNFTLSFASANESFTEELNGANDNSMADANEISLGTQYRGQIAKNDERDFYRFELPSSGTISLEAASFMPAVSYKLFDESGNQLWNTNKYWDSNTQTGNLNQDLVLTKGTYVLSVTKYDGTGRYQMKLSFNSSNESFGEVQGGSNNSLDTANQIALNTVYRGQIALNDVKDFYQFTMPSAGKISAIVAKPNGSIVMYIYNADGQELKHYYYSSENISQDIELEGGTYYFAVIRDGGYTHYSFQLKSELAPEPTPKPTPTPTPKPTPTPTPKPTPTPTPKPTPTPTPKPTPTPTPTPSPKPTPTPTPKPTPTPTPKPTPTPAPKPTNFTDVEKTEYYAEPVNWAVEHGVTAGTIPTSFSPAADCTRAQVVTFLWRTNGAPKTGAMNPFKDVSSGAYYYDAVLWAVSKGITQGTSSTTFSPDASCTRAHVVTFLWRAEGSPVPKVTKSSFTDVAANAYYANAVLWAVEKNITQGTSATTFSPNATCSRAQIVTFLYRDMTRTS